MPQLNERQVKGALVVAKHAAALQEERRRALVPETLSASPEVVSCKHAVHAMQTSLLSRVGVDFEQLEQARLAHDAALSRAGDEALTAAIAQSAAETPRLQSVIERRQKMLEAVTAIDPTVPNPQRVLINTPFLIWPTLGVFFDSSEIKPAGSSAKFRVDSSDDGAAEMNFYFMWQNETDKFAVINVNGYLVLSGHVRVRSGGGFFADNRHSSVTLNANLHYLEWWNQPPTGQSVGQQALTVSVHTGAMLDDAASKTASIFRGFDLSLTSRIVPPRGVVVVQMGAGIWYSNNEGTVAVDFASGDFQAIAPAVLVTILT